MTTSHPEPRRLYARHADAADRGRWSVERGVRWEAIDVALARSQPAILAALRDAALIEAYHPVNLAALLAETWEDVDAGVVFSLELYEGFKHFHVLRRYLEAVGHEPALSDDDIVAGRRAALAESAVGAPDALIERLVEFMLSEHLAGYFFRRLAEQAAEPVLAEILALVADDEVRHAQSASDLLEKRIAADPALATRVLDAAMDFRHYGARVVGDVPVAMPGDEVAIRTFAKRIERLCGVRLVDHIASKIL
jgi:hypothetical protein